MLIYVNMRGGEICEEGAFIFESAVTLLNYRAKINRQKNEQTAQHFGKINRGASLPTSESAYAPHLLLP